MVDNNELHRRIYRGIRKRIFQEPQGQEGVDASYGRKTGAEASVRKTVEGEASWIMATENRPLQGMV
ncbi:MAG: hypothetical protein AMDU5_GPLC00018G0003 [Thermoplasmatales archaeon Gpl]|nr:MAG: hypothetical protein AMDU5_GPLC00018G0003 [Thermoplasmatales archaeon Gpl]